GPQELALANADGPGLLRDRVNGGSCIALRYCSIRCRSDALFTAAMRCDDCGGYRFLQKRGGGEKKFRGKARGGGGGFHWGMRFHRRGVLLVRRVAGER